MTVTCINCGKACFAASLEAEYRSRTLMPTHHMTLTCQSCAAQMQFVVDLLPDFERSKPLRAHDVPAVNGRQR
jgi:RNase P subunit RPR2